MERSDMAVEIRVPALGESIVDAVIASWLKCEGDSVSQGDALVELETDKVNVEVTAEQSGVLQKILKQEGDVVAVGDVLGRIRVSEEVVDLRSLRLLDRQERREAMHEVKMPRLSDTMQEGTIARWLKKAGDEIKKGDILAEIETDKATMDLESYDAGVLQQILVQADETVPVGTDIALIGTGRVSVEESARAGTTTDQPEGKLMQDKERQAVLAFLEYIEAFQEASGKDELIPFDTGTYRLGEYDLDTAIYYLTKLINESLRKKTIARSSRKPLKLDEIKYLLGDIASYLGICNIIGTELGYNSLLACLLYERPSGFLEPLTDAEWQELAKKAVADMLVRRQYKRDQGKISDADETETNFVDEIYQKNCNYFGTSKKYPLANDKAKHAAQAIVDAEKARLTPFLEALQGTLRFLDRLTRLQKYQERQLPVYEKDIDTPKVVLAEVEAMVALLTSLLEDDISAKEQPVQKSKQKIRIVESKVTPTTTASLQVRKEEHTGNLHTYHLTLTDSKHLSEPVLFLLQVSESGEAELFEDDSNG